MIANFRRVPSAHLIRAGDDAPCLHEHERGSLGMITRRGQWKIMYRAAMRPEW
jgi:hypothetical protein